LEKCAQQVLFLISNLTGVELLRVVSSIDQVGKSILSSALDPALKKKLSFLSKMEGIAHVKDPAEVKRFVALTKNARE